uniref:Uncharacterized protein n=1 Tax=Plectus sambesii TaxID=2011161 RepID=A0A914X8C0_9BILA
MEAFRYGSAPMVPQNFETISLNGSERAVDVPHHHLQPKGLPPRPPSMSRMPRGPPHPPSAPPPRRHAQQPIRPPPPPYPVAAKPNYPAVPLIQPHRPPPPPYPGLSLKERPSSLATDDFVPQETSTPKSERAFSPRFPIEENGIASAIVERDERAEKTASLYENVDELMSLAQNAPDAVSNGEPRSRDSTVWYEYGCV